jgi:hypothetical protein
MKIINKGGFIMDKLEYEINVLKPKEGDILLFRYKTIDGEPIATDEELSDFHNRAREMFNGDVITVPDYINIDLVDKKFLEDSIKVMQEMLDKME